MDEARLIEKLRLIEALFSGATTEGEKVAAERARVRMLERLRRQEAEDSPVEYRFSMADMWSRKVFVALLRRYGIRPYRYSVAGVPRDLGNPPKLPLRGDRSNRGAGDPPGRLRDRGRREAAAAVARPRGSDEYGDDVDDATSDTGRRAEDGLRGSSARCRCGESRQDQAQERKKRTRR